MIQMVIFLHIKKVNAIYFKTQLNIKKHDAIFNNSLFWNI